MEQVFTHIYETSIWGSNNNDGYNGSSGGGSDIDYNKNTYVPFVKDFITNMKIKSIDNSILISCVELVVILVVDLH